MSAAIVVPAVANGQPARALSSPEFPVIARHATALVHAQATSRKANFLMGEGTPSSDRLVNTAAAIVKWHFVFDNQPTRNRYKSAGIRCHNGTFGAVHASRDLIVGNKIVQRIPSMTLARAVTLLKRAGYRSGFSDVTYYFPELQGVTAPGYFFTVKGEKVIEVVARTGKVKRIM